MTGKCCHSQVRATRFCFTSSACLWACKLYAQQTALEYSPVPVLPRVVNHYIRPDHDLVIDFQINTWCAWTRITVVLRLTQGNRKSMVTLGSQPTTYSPTHKHFSYNQWHPIAFYDFVCYNPGTISYRGLRKPLTVTTLLRLVAVFNLHRKIPRNAFDAHTHLFKVLSAP